MEAETKFQIVAEVYKCLLSCDSVASHYSFVLRIGNKQSPESTKRAPINQNAIEFNQRTSLLINQIDKSRAINCEIILFQYKNGNQKSTAGVASVSIEDLRSKQKRPVRLVNNFDKRASIELNIYEDRIDSEISKSSKCLLSNTKPNRQCNPRNLRANLLYPSRNQLTLSRKKFDYLSQSSGTKTCPNNDLQNSKELPTQRKFSRKRDSSNSNKLISCKENNKSPVESPINQIEKKLKLIKNGSFFHQIDHLNKEDIIGQRKPKIRSLNRLDSQHSNSLDCIMIESRNEVKSKQENFEIHKSVDEKVNLDLKKGRNLKFNLRVVAISINFDENKKKIIDAETNTERMVLKNLGIGTDKKVCRSSGTDTWDLIELWEMEIQTIWTLDKFEGLKDVMNQETFTYDLGLKEERGIQTILEEKRVQTKETLTENLTEKQDKKIQTISEPKKVERPTKQFKNQETFIAFDLIRRCQQQIQTIQSLNKGKSIKEVLTKQTFTEDLILKREKEIQTQFTLENSHILNHLIQTETPNFDIDQSLDLRSRVRKATQQDDEEKIDMVNYTLTKGGKKSTQEKQSQSQSQGVDDDQLFDLKLSLCSQSLPSKHSSLAPKEKTIIIDKCDAMPEQFQPLYIRQKISPELPNLKREFNGMGEHNLPFEPFEFNSYHSQQRNSEHSQPHYLSIVKTVELRVRSLRENQSKSIYSNIKTLENSKSNIGKIGFIKKPQTPQFCDTIQEINESLQESHDFQIIKPETPPFYEMPSEYAPKKPKNVGFLDVNNNDSDDDVSCRINQENSIIQFSEIIEEQDEDLWNAKFQEETAKEVSQKDINSLARETRHHQETNLFDIKQANQFLELTNVSIAEALEEAKYAFSYHLFDCQINTVSKQEHTKVERELKELQEQLKNVELSKLKLNEEKIKLEAEKEERIKQIDFLKKENLKLSENFKILKKQYHSFAYEAMEREAQSTKKNNQNSKKGNKSINSESHIKMITREGSNVEFFPYTQSKFLKTQNVFSQKEYENYEILNSKFSKTYQSNQNSVPMQYYSTDLRLSKNDERRKFSAGSLSEKKYSDKDKIKEEGDSCSIEKHEKKEFRLFIEKSKEKKESKEKERGVNLELSGFSKTPKSDMSGFSKSGRSQTISKIQYKKSPTNEGSFLSGFQSTIIEDFMSNDNSKY